MAVEREVAGLRCGQVLAGLSDYLDGDLGPDRRAQIQGHLQGCDVCARFGGRFSAAIQALRQGELPDSGQEGAVFGRLGTFLEEAMGEGLT